MTPSCAGCCVYRVDGEAVADRIAFLSSDCGEILFEDYIVLALFFVKTVVVELVKNCRTVGSRCIVSAVSVVVNIYARCP